MKMQSIPYNLSAKLALLGALVSFPLAGQAAELEPVADTWVRIDLTVGEPKDTILSAFTYGDDDTLEMRSRDGSDAGYAVRERTNYFRFDVSGVPEEELVDLEFVAYTGGGRAWLSHQGHHLYGLVPGIGHTPQDWDEYTLNWDTIGAELDQSTLGNEVVSADELRFPTLPFFGALPASADLQLESGEVRMSWSGPGLDAFVRARKADNGLVTLIIAGRPNSDRAVEDVYSREWADADFRPKLVYGASQSNTWGGYEVSPEGDADTADWMGWVNVTNGLWVYSYSLDAWMYLEEPAEGSSGSWAYIFNF